MNAYESLAGAYDGLTRDIPYEKILDFIEAVLQKGGKRPETVLDLACGTGSMSVLLAKRGYRVLASDISEEMLTVAAEKAMELEENPPFFIHQSMQRLRLPQPVELVVCLLDSLNYLDEPADCPAAFRRVWQALTPGVWRAEFDAAENRCYYGIDLFRRQGALWARSFEQHCEYAYEPQTLEKWLTEAGFARVVQYGDCALRAPQAAEQRIYFAAYKE